MSSKLTSCFALLFLINVSADHHGTVHSHSGHASPDVDMAYLKSTNGMPSSKSKDGKSKEWMIEVMTTAAPSFIGNNASVATYEGKILREGTNGWTCSPGRPMPKGGYKDAQDTNASCADIEGFKWVEAYVNGTTPDMKRDAYIWMLHGDVGEDNRRSSLYGGSKDDAIEMNHFIESGPHLMLMPKDPKTIENFTTDFTTGEPYQMFKGSPYAHLMIPFEGYYMFQPEAAPK